MEGIDQYIKTLTLDEIEKHNELIRECRLREAELLICRENSLKDAKRLGVLTGELLEGVTEIYASAESLKKTYKEFLNDILQGILEKIPEDRYFHS
jgi:hypothetical protein